MHIHMYVCVIAGDSTLFSHLLPLLEKVDYLYIYI